MEISPRVPRSFMQEFPGNFCRSFSRFFLGVLREASSGSSKSFSAMPLGVSLEILQGFLGNFYESSLRIPPIVTGKNSPGVPQDYPQNFVGNSSRSSYGIHDGIHPYDPRSFSGKSQEFLGNSSRNSMGTPQ